MFKRLIIAIIGAGHVAHATGPQSSSSQIIIDTMYGSDFFVKISADLLDEQNQIHSGTVEFDFSSRSSPASDLFGNLRREIIYRSVSMGGHVLDMAGLRVYANTVDPKLYISLNPVSNLMWFPGVPNRGFLLSPASDSSGVFVINPENPQEYAFDDQIFYTNANDERTWSFPAAIRVFDDENELAHSSPIDGGDGFTSCHLYDPAVRSDTPTPGALNVPSSILYLIHSRLTAIGVVLSSLPHLMHGFDPSMFDRLPKIQYIMQTNDGRLVNLVVLEPRDYIKQATDGNYHLLLRTAYTGPNSVVRDCTMNASMMKKLVIHFDIANNRIGFGEPIVEL